MRAVSRAVLVLHLALGTGAATLPLPSMAAEAPAQPKLAVMPLQTLRGVERDVVTILTGMITTRAGASHLFSQVISADEVAAVLKAEKLKDALGCSDVACAAEIGGAPRAHARARVGGERRGPL